MIFEDRIQVNPRLFRLKDPRTNEIVDFEIQDLLPEEIIQEGTEVGARELNGQIVNEHSESTSNTYSCNYVNKFKPEAIYCNLSADVQMTNNYYNISNWSQVKKVGDGFSISSGKIHIGAGINTIKITVKVGVGVNANSLFYSYIIKNSGNLTESREIHYIRASEPQIVYNQAVTSVSEGDVITISHYGDGTIMRESTSIIVEKID